MESPEEYIKRNIEIDDRCQHFTREQWMKYYIEDCLNAANLELCKMCRNIKPKDGHSVCEECGGINF